MVSNMKIRGGTTLCKFTIIHHTLVAIVIATGSHCQNNSLFVGGTECMHTWQPVIMFHTNSTWWCHFVLNPLNAKLSSLKVLFGLVPLSPVFPLLPGVSPRKLIHSFLQKFFVGSWLWPHPLITEHSIVRALQPENAPPDRSCLKG